MRGKGGLHTHAYVVLKDAHVQNISHGASSCPCHCLRKGNTTILNEESTVLDVLIGDILVNKYFNNIATYLLQYLEL
jgi:hypothetical protein